MSHDTPASEFKDDETDPSRPDPEGGYRLDELEPDMTTKLTQLAEEAAKLEEREQLGGLLSPTMRDYYMRAWNGDTRKCHELISWLCDQLMPILKRRLGNRIPPQGEDAYDILQILLLRLHKFVGDGRQSWAPRTRQQMLYLAIHTIPWVVADVLKTRQKDLPFRISFEDQAVDYAADKRIPAGSGPDFEFEQNEWMDWILASIEATAGNRAAQVIKLKAAEGLSSKVVAERLGISKDQVFRAKESAKRALLRLLELQERETLEWERIERIMSRNKGLR